MVNMVVLFESIHDLGMSLPLSCERGHIHLEWAAASQNQQGSSLLLQGLSWWCSLGHHRR